MTDTPQPVSSLPHVAPQRQELIRVVLLGLVVGIVIPLVGWLLATYFITPVFCQTPETFSVCATGGVTAYYIAAMLTTIGAVALLSSWTVYRALLLGVGAMLALWGLKYYIDPLTIGNWLEYYVFSALLYAVAYAASYWILRIRHFAVSVAVLVVMVVAVRWALTA